MSETSMPPTTSINRNDESRPKTPGPSKFWRVVWDYFAFIALILISLFGVLFPIINEFYFTPRIEHAEHTVAAIKALKNEVSVLLHVLGALSLIIGIGLWMHFHRVEQHIYKDEEFSDALLRDIKEHFASDTTTQRDIKNNLDENKKFLLSLLGGRFLSKYSDIHNCLLGLVTRAQNEIKLLAYGDIWLDKAEDEWTNKLATHLENEKLNHSNDINYRVVACLPMSQQGVEKFFATFDRRLDIYRNHKVYDRVQVRLINDNEPIGLNVLIVDDMHVALTFSFHGEKEVDSCIIFEGKNEVASRLRSWFDNAVFNLATPYEDMKNKVINEQSR